MDCYHEFLRMPLEMVNSEGTLTRTVRKLLRGVDVVEYIDYVLVHRPTCEDDVKTCEHFGRTFHAFVEGKLHSETKMCVLKGAERATNLQGENVDKVQSASRAKTKQEFRALYIWLDTWKSLFQTKQRSQHHSLI
ncbi:Zinc finger protein [Plakobranchus ocellatus]|uniref:Zinc finger protein n=1 Tax=Plakobranchus ocellatus TaxID=259542 RepID=A0AAV3Y282_9GAST|nr:Zinc finger protein [Plakobranchus ocellatus]